MAKIENIIDSHYKFLRTMNDHVYNLPQLLPHKKAIYNHITAKVNDLSVILVKKHTTECKFTQNIINRYSPFKMYNHYSEQEQIIKTRYFVMNNENVMDLYKLIDWSLF